MTQHSKHITEERMALMAELILSGKREQISVSDHEHINECESCAAELMSLIEILEDEDGITSMPSKKNNQIKPLFWIAAAAAILIFAFLFFPDKNKPSVKQQIAEQQKKQEVIIEEPATNTKVEKAKPIVPEPKQEVVEKEFLKLNEKFENQIIEYQDAYRSEAFQLLSPVYLNSSDHQKIEWQSTNNEFIIEWWSINEELIKEETTEQNSFNLPKFETGTYYFKLLNSDFDVLSMGRYVVEK